MTGAHIYMLYHEIILSIKAKQLIHNSYCLTNSSLLHRALMYFANSSVICCSEVMN